MCAAFGSGVGILKYADTHKIAANTAIIVISTVVNLFFMCVQGCQAPDIQFAVGNQNCTREGSRFWRSLFIQTSSRKITPRMPWMNALETPTISRPLFRAATVKAPSRPA